MFWNKLKRKNKSEFECLECGLVHSNWPALAFVSPSNYHDLDENEKKEIAELDADFCTIEFSDQMDRFIRVTLTQQVNASGEDLDYGLWVSLSEKSFNDYRANFNNQNIDSEYFGWLCSRIPGYDNTMSIPTTVVTQIGGQRPKIFPHKDHNHQFVIDFYRGITAHEAQERVVEMVNNVG